MSLFIREPTGREIITDAYHGHDCKYQTRHNNQKSWKQQKTSGSESLSVPLTAYPLGNVPYYSEWGKNPRQAAQIRNLMFGVGEIISSIFIFCVASPVVGWTALPTLGYDGVTRIFNSLNELWADHQIEMVELKKLTDQAVKLGEI